MTLSEIKSTSKKILCLSHKNLIILVKSFKSLIQINEDLTVKK